MLLLTEDAVLVCLHEQGVVGIEATQALVTIAGRRVLVEHDPENRPIAGCPNIALTILPCLKTEAVRHGYSEWISILGRRVCLDIVRGLTNGTPPQTVEYKVRSAGQDIVEQRS